MKKFHVIDLSSGASDPPEHQMLTMDEIEEQYPDGTEGVIIFSGELIKWLDGSIPEGLKPHLRNWP